MTQQKSSLLLKSFLDVLGASVGLAATWPLLMVLAVAIKIQSKGPVIYRRRVVGKDGRLFAAYKLRTMIHDAEDVLERDKALKNKYYERFKLKDDPRITTIGAFLRKYSLDEIPQLFNVLRGEMSLVGPRMLTQEEADLYGTWKVAVLSMKPGLTGLWQVLGRQNVPFQRRIELDVEYVSRWSLGRDMVILTKTVPAALKAEGAC